MTHTANPGPVTSWVERHRKLTAVAVGVVMAGAAIAWILLR